MKMKRIRWIAAALCVLAVLCFAGTEARAEGYTLTLNLNHDGLPPEVYENITSIDLPTPEREGYRFEGWYRRDDEYECYAGGVSFDMNQDEELTAQWTEGDLINGIPPMDGGYVWLAERRWRVIGGNDREWLLITADVYEEGLFESIARFVLGWKHCDRWFIGGEDLNNSFSFPEGYAVKPHSYTYDSRNYHNHPDGDGYSLSNNMVARTFILTTGEATTYFASDEDRQPGKWWLANKADVRVEDRGKTKKDVRIYYYQYVVGGGGEIYGEYDQLGGFGIRPVCIIDATRVLFESAEGVKPAPDTGFRAFAAPAPGEDRHLTMRMKDHEISAGLVRDTVSKQGNIAVEYSGAPADRFDVISAVICDAGGSFLYYASAAPDASGSGVCAFPVPEELDVGNYILKVFSEWRYDGTACDGIGTMVSLPFTVTASGSPEGSGTEEDPWLLTNEWLPDRLTEGWYRATENLIWDERLQVSGSVTLTTDEGTGVAAWKGISVENGGSLFISGGGTLTAAGGDEPAVSGNLTADIGLAVAAGADSGSAERILRTEPVGECGQPWIRISPCADHKYDYDTGRDLLTCRWCGHTEQYTLPLSGSGTEADPWQISGNDIPAYLVPGWYRTTGSTAWAERAEFMGDTHLTLGEGTLLTLEKGAYVPAEYSLEIAGPGALAVAGTGEEAAISGTVILSENLKVFAGETAEEAAACRTEERADGLGARYVRIEGCEEHGYELDEGTLTCCWCGSGMSWQEMMESSGTQDRPYPIGDAATWRQFAGLLKLGMLNTDGKYFRLTNDISVSTMMGTESRPFNGVFDGGGHTLKFDYDEAPETCAPFRYVGTAAIRHLRVRGEIRAYEKFAAGLVGRVTGSCEITDCESRIVITSSVSGDGTHGGFVATGQNVTIRGSVFTGILRGARTGYSAGFIGWDEGGHSRIIDCVYDGTCEMPNNCGTFVRNTDEAENSYYVPEKAIGQNRDKGRPMRAVTAGAEDMTIDPGSAAVYPVSGITGYPAGLSRGGTYYAGEGDELILTLTSEPEEGWVVERYIGIRQDNYSAFGIEELAGGRYRFIMPDAAVVLTRDEKPVFPEPDFVLPEDIRAVEEAAFEGAAMHAVRIPDSCTAIGPRAFASCPNLTRVRIPAGCTISAEAFDNDQRIYIFGTRGSPAETYCRNNGNCIFQPEE